MEFSVPGDAFLRRMGFESIASKIGEGGIDPSWLELSWLVKSSSLEHASSVYRRNLPP